uniref:Histidine phosphatase family protein n=1 Tax=Schlesneria paludicola TaxID=360056 RepID=A0A7C4LLY9_9PLAN
MKTLLLLRHGKSSWDDPDQDDHSRPLKPRGRKAAKRIGRWLQDAQLPVDLVLCSTAARARDTWAYVADQLQNVPRVEFLHDLYHCPVTGFVQVLRDLPDSVMCVLVVGHNPGMEDLLAQLTDQRETMPTGALAHLECPLDTWTDFEADLPCTLKTVIRPRELDRE